MHLENLLLKTIYKQNLLQIKLFYKNQSKVDGY